MEVAVKQEYIELKQQWVKAHGAEREAVQRKLEALLDSLDEEGRKQVIEAVSEDFEEIHAKVNSK